ncbi:hypothetical protein ACFU7T_04345 [Streptomyces sp. NPDC057555]|uniref:hypothetical protein n=1 Tax=Streptomyces sp. NPDC057555 TaxID=3346166 RepID=UPI0036946A78
MNAPRSASVEGRSGTPGQVCTGAAVDGTVAGLAISRTASCGNGSGDLCTSTAAYRHWIEST